MKTKPSHAVKAEETHGSLWQAGIQAIGVTGVVVGGLIKPFTTLVERAKTWRIARRNRFRIAALNAVQCGMSFFGWVQANHANHGVVETLEKHLKLPIRLVDSDYIVGLEKSTGIPLRELTPLLIGWRRPACSMVAFDKRNNATYLVVGHTDHMLTLDVRLALSRMVENYEAQQSTQLGAFLKMLGLAPREQQNNSSDDLPY